MVFRAGPASRRVQTPRGTRAAAGGGLRDLGTRRALTRGLHGREAWGPGDEQMGTDATGKDTCDGGRPA